MKHKWMVFIDFDGTITSEETLTGAIMRLNPPGLEQEYKKMLAQELTISAGVQLLFNRVPSSDYPVIEEYIKTVPAREGFGDFLEYCASVSIPVVVVSGGLIPMIDITLAPYRHLIQDVHAVTLDLSGPNMRLACEYDDGVETMKKTAILEQYQYENAICIGDGYTDFRMTELADVVFARDQLAQYLKSQGTEFHSWDDFNDITKIFKQLKLRNDE